MKNKMLKGTIILTVAGVITRVIGFLYRIFLANLLGDTKLGIYQMIFPIYGICFTLYASGLQTAVSQLVADPHLKNSKRVLKCGIFCSLCCSITLFVLLFTFFRLDKYSFAVCKRNGTIVKILSVIFPFCGITSIINGYFYGKRHAKVPSITQIIEQFCRVGFVVAVFFCFQKSISCEIAVLGLIVGEMASNIYNMWNIRKRIFWEKENSKSRYGELIKTAGAGNPIKRYAPYHLGFVSGRSGSNSYYAAIFRIESNRFFCPIWNNHGDCASIYFISGNNHKFAVGIASSGSIQSIL